MKKTKEISEKPKVQVSFSLMDAEGGDNFIENLSLVFLSKVDSVIFPLIPSCKEISQKSKLSAEKINEEFSLGINSLPKVRCAIGMLDPFLKNYNFYKPLSDMEEFSLEKMKKCFLDLRDSGVDGIRFHPGDLNEQEFVSIWEFIIEIFPAGGNTILLDRVNKSNAHLKNLIIKAYQIGEPGLIVEVDGASSFEKDNYSDTIQTLATADIIIKDFLIKEKRKYKLLEIYLSGDINNKIKALSKIVNIPYQGITFGTCYNDSLSRFLQLARDDIDLSIKSFYLEALNQLNNSYTLKTYRQN
tara:strand:- start:37472 stop:38371 length:900 start_codon:yes stop_codon:yes gene_type:complete